MPGGVPVPGRLEVPVALFDDACIGTGPDMFLMAMSLHAWKRFRKRGSMATRSPLSPSWVPADAFAATSPDPILLDCTAPPWLRASSGEVSEFPME